MTKHNRFTNRFGQPSTFKCMTCKRMTRDTGQGVDHLCMECFEIAGLDNQVNDSGEPCPANVLAECERLLNVIASRGGDVEHVKQCNAYIWSNKPVEPAKPLSVLDIETSKSYATEANLMKVLKQLGLDEMHPLVVCNRKGRFTAVFGMHLSGMAKSGDVMRAARSGFKTID